MFEVRLGMTVILPYDRGKLIFGPPSMRIAMIGCWGP